MGRESTFRRVLVPLGVAAAVVVAGGIAFRIALDEPWHEALYRAVVTASLTGLDSRPSGRAGEIITVILVLAGLAIFAYVASVIVEAITGGILSGALGARRRRHAIEKLRDHYVICGYGRVGRRVAREFREAGAPFVVLDFSADAVREAAEHGDLLVEGTGTEDEDLIEAGIDRAVGLVVASDSDADNLYITLSARSRRADLLIVARASDEDAGKKLRLAGADRIVQPYSTAGREMAQLVLKPQVAALMDVFTDTGQDFRFEEIEVMRGSQNSGKSLRDLRVRERTGAMIIGVRKRDGTFDATPSPDVVFEEGDVMIGAGTADELQALEELFGPGQPRVA
jgi:voltage-gated potassium channel